MKNQSVKLPLSIVIPAFNEEKHLPKLLSSLQAQVFQPSEVIVADGHSKDRTVEIAESFGVKVVEGGLVAEGRNRGAEAATQPVILFFDADVSLPNEFFLGEMYVAFRRDELDIMSVLQKPDTKDSKLFENIASNVVFSGWNGIRRLYKLTKKLLVEYGGAIMVKKSVFLDVGGFTEKHGMYGEDYLFTQQALKKGYKYKVLTLKILTSPRRYSEPLKASKVLVGATLMGALFAFGLYNRKNLMDLVKRLYGDLGGTKK